VHLPLTIWDDINGDAPNTNIRISRKDYFKLIYIATIMNCFTKEWKEYPYLTLDADYHVRLYREGLHAYVEMYENNILIWTDFITTKSVYSYFLPMLGCGSYPDTYTSGVFKNFRFTT
jgi:hypothetical protein